AGGAVRRRARGAPGGARRYPRNLRGAREAARLHPAPVPDWRPLRTGALFRGRRRQWAAERPLPRDAPDHGRYRGAPSVKSRPRKRAAPRSGAAESERLGGGRFTAGADPAAERFTGSLAFDRRLWPHDLAGSVAWARALARAGLLSNAERDAIVRGLATIRDELAAGTFPFRPE